MCSTAAVRCNSKPVVCRSPTTSSACASGPVGRSLPGSAELPRATRCAPRRHRSRAGALTRRHVELRRLRVRASPPQRRLRDACRLGCAC
eukprot:scaffold39925_cov33-Phaeocystis_antarctica.AAC.3